MKNIPAAPSIVRTLVPLAVAQIVAFAASMGLSVSDDAQDAFAQVIGWLAAALYYLAVRFLEQKWPKLGALLGWAETPDGYSHGHPSNDGLVSSEGEPVGDFEDLGEDPNALVVDDGETPDSDQPKH